jgi:transposase InsO family protein
MWQHSWTTSLLWHCDWGGVVKSVITTLQTQPGLKVINVRTDNSSGYTDSELESYFDSKGIGHHTTVPYTPEQNGKSEQPNRRLMEKVRCMMPAKAQGKTMITASVLRNRSPVAGTAVTPIFFFRARKLQARQQATSR